MKEYIEIDKNTFPTPFIINTGAYARGWNACLNSVLRHKVVDVEPVRHGEWIEYQMPNIICCSKCDWGTSVEEKFFNYCPNCGAKMDGGKK